MPETVRGFTLKEIAAKVGRSTATIVRWIDVGKVKIKKKKNAQGQYFFTEGDLEKFKSYNQSVRMVD